MSRRRCGGSRRATASPSTASCARRRSTPQRAGDDAARSAQGQYRAAQDAFHQSRAALRGRQYSGGPRRGDPERRRGVAARRRRRQARPAVARHQQQDHPDQFQSVLDGAGLDRAQGSHSEDAGSAGLSDRQSHPHPRRASKGSCSRRRSIGTRRMRPITRSSRIPAPRIRSARSASIFRAPTACTCTTRR